MNIHGLLEQPGRLHSMQKSSTALSVLGLSNQIYSFLCGICSGDSVSICVKFMHMQ